MSSLLALEPQKIAPPRSVEVIRCGVGDEIYCLEMSVVASVMPARDLRSIDSDSPHSPVGVLAYRQNDIPVFDLSALLGRSSAPQRDSQYVVLIKHPSKAFGLRVDSVSRVIRLG
ncbi:MAG: chemotaxis protein CheW, partial [Planctomycetaceae bacterium]|nr:chemotaxis protein CheW [Planctomycetaceae bacterium]